MDRLQQRMVEEIPALRRYALMLTQNADAADDLVQDSLERAWKHLASWKRGSNLRAWLFTIMHNQYINGLRYLERRPALLNLDCGEQLATVTQSADAHIQLEELQKAIKRLPLEQREVITLVAVEGESYKQVARILDIPIGTVMSRLHRGREALRSQLFQQPPAQFRRIK